jgi:ABC-type phosphate transport system auxiliary subunit
MMSDGEGRKAGDAADGGGEVASDFMILRTFSMTKPGAKALYMNALNWQAAWLQEHFNWVRVVVGYALTDIPERVLEIYGVPLPEKDLAVARKVLESLHAQPEYALLLECCREDLPREEELLPALGFDTRLKEVIEAIMAEQGLVVRRRSALQELERLRGELATADASVKKLEGQVAAAIENISKLELQLAQLEGQRSRNLDDQIRTLRERIAKERLRLTRLQDDLKAAKAHKAGLESQQAKTQQELTQVEQQLREAMDPVKRAQTYEMMLNLPAYFLNVTIHVKPGFMKTFEEGMQTLAHDFKWDFLAAGRPLPGTGAPGGEPGSETVMNLWGFKDANNLYQQMLELQENVRFAALEEITGDESQMLMCDWEALSGMKRPPPLHL